MGTDLSRALGEIAGEASHATGGLPVDALRGRFVRRAVARGTAAVAASLVVVAGLGVVANALLTSTPPASAPGPTTTHQPAPPVTSPPPTEAAPEVADPVVLGRQGVGDLAMGTEDPLPALTERLGEPDEVRPGDGPDCAATAASVAVWGDLAVTVARNPEGDGPDGPFRLMAWWVTGPDLPEGVSPASGVQPGVPMDDVRAMAGAQEVAWSVVGQVVVAVADVMHLPGADDTVEAVAYAGISCR